MDSLRKRVQNGRRSNVVQKVGIWIEVGERKGLEFLSFSSEIIVDKVYHLAIRCC